jgi:hypothetical protein
MLYVDSQHKCMLLPLTNTHVLKFVVDRIKLSDHKTPSCKMGVRVRLRMLKLWGKFPLRLIDGSILSSLFLTL